MNMWCLVVRGGFNREEGVIDPFERQGIRKTVD